MQLSGRIGVIRACALPNIVAPFLTYGIIRFRRSNMAPSGLHLFINYFISDLMFENTNSGEQWDGQNLMILGFAILSCLILGWEGMTREAASDHHHHFERSLWSRSEGPGLFTNLNFLLNRQRSSPDIPKKETQPPKTILFMATCYYNEASEELTGSLESIKKSIDNYLHNMHKEKLKRVKDGEKYHEKYLDRHLEVHLAIDTCFKETDKETIDMKDIIHNVIGDMT